MDTPPSSEVLYPLFRESSVASLIRREQGKVYDVDYIIDPIGFHKRNIKSRNRVT